MLSFEVEVRQRMGVRVLEKVKGKGQGLVGSLVHDNTFFVIVRWSQLTRLLSLSFQQLLSHLVPTSFASMSTSTSNIHVLASFLEDASPTSIYISLHLR